PLFTEKLTSPAEPIQPDRLYQSICAVPVRLPPFPFTSAEKTYRFPTSMLALGRYAWSEAVSPVLRLIPLVPEVVREPPHHTSSLFLRAGFGHRFTRIRSIGSGGTSGSSGSTGGGTTSTVRVSVRPPSRVKSRLIP